MKEFSQLPDFPISRFSAELPQIVSSLRPAACDYNQPLTLQNAPNVQLSQIGVRKNALDTVCDSVSPVADRGCEQLHVGWVHSHSAGARDHRTDLPVDQRAPDRCVSR